MGLIDWLLGRRMLQRRCVGSTQLIFNPQHDEVVREYYLYVVELYSDALRALGLSVDIVFGEYPVTVKRNRRLFRVLFQIEHILVRPGGRGTAGAPPSALPVLGHPEEHYLVRLQDAERLAQADAIVEYSQPNFQHLHGSGHWPELASRLHYIAPLIHPLAAAQTKDGREFAVVTLFGNPNEPRRKALLEALTHWNPACRNIRGRFSDVREVYRTVRILVNVRQTEHHHTLEELRVLPALLSGVVVVCEDVPLRELVPYHPFIVWAPVGAVVDTVRHVHENYDAYFQQIFGGPALNACIHRLQESNRAQVELTLKAFDESSQKTTHSVAPN